MSDRPSPEQVWRDYNRRIQSKDRAGLRDILHPDFVGVDPEGTARQRDPYVDFCCEHLPDDLDIQFEAIEGTEIAEGALLITTRQRMGPHPMAPSDDGYMAVSMFSVWVDEGGWKLRAQQGMLVA